MGPLRSHNNRRVATFLVVIVVILPLVAGIATAQSYQGGSGTIVVEAGETVDRIDAVAGTVVIRGTVTGGVSGAAGSIRIAESGRVGGNIEVAAGSVILDGEVDGDVQVGGGSFELGSTGRIGGSLTVGAGTVNIDGTVEGDVRAGADTVVLGPNADVAGEFRYDAETFTQNPEASVAGDVVRDPSLRGDGGTGFGVSAVPSWVGPVYGFLTSLVLGAVLLLVFPRFSSDVASRIAENPLPSLGIGLVALVVLPILIGLIAITVIGIPLALVGLAIYVIALWVATVYGKYSVGRWALLQAGSDSRWLALIFGLIGFALLGQIPVIGGVFELVALLLGLGGFALGIRERYGGERPTEVSASQPTEAD